MASAGIPLNGHKDPEAAPVRGPHDPGVRDGRWQSARGPMGPSGWLHYPAAWWRARRGRSPERPWIVPAAVGWLRRRIRSDWSVLELGAGRSTIWFGRRAGYVVSFEDNAYWVDQTRRRLDELQLLDVDLRPLAVEAFAVELDGLPEGSFDLVVIDFLESPRVTRIDLLEPAMRKVAPRGLLLLDDSDRPGYAEADELLGWKRRRFTGVKDGWPEVCETTIFRSPK